MNKLILAFIFTLTLYTACFAQSNFTDNTFVITTYYPAPYGVYTNLRLHPSDDPTGKEGVIEGVMYYDRTLHMMRYLNNATWVNVTAGDSVSGGLPLVYSAHTQSDCTNHIPPGEVVDTDVGFKQCRFNLTACPAYWIQYQGWSTTTGGGSGYAPAGSCGGGSWSACSLSVASGHPWGNGGIPAWQGCKYVLAGCSGWDCSVASTPVGCFEAKYANKCVYDYCGWYDAPLPAGCNACSFVKYCAQASCYGGTSCDSKIICANVTQVGCY